VGLHAAIPGGGGGIGTDVNVTDRAARVLGVADVSDRAARQLGAVDVTDDDARLVGLAGLRTLADVISSSFTSAPAANTIFADTGPLAAGLWEFDVAAGSTVAYATLQWQHRDATNTTTLNVGPLLIPANGLAYSRFRIRLAANERLRITASASSTGNVTVFLAGVKLSA
jgi:hypothetical protein